MSGEVQRGVVIILGEGATSREENGGREPTAYVSKAFRKRNGGLSRRVFGVRNGVFFFRLSSAVPHQIDVNA